MSNKDNGHIIRLTNSNCDRAVINLKVTGKAELEKASELFNNLTKLSNKALRGSDYRIGGAFFRLLKYEVESFNEFIEFFDVSPVGLAAGMTQLRFHELAVENWDDIGATINSRGRRGGEYKLPPPTMMLVLRSKAYQKEHGNTVMNDSLDDNLVGVSEISYICSDKDAKILEDLEKYVPKKALAKAMGCITMALRDSSDLAMSKLMNGDEEPDIDMAYPPSRSEKDMKFAKNKIKEILSGLEGDDFFKKLGEVLRDDDMRDFISSDFNDWLNKNGGDGREMPVMPMPGEIHGEA